MIKSLKITPNKILTELPRLNQITARDLYINYPERYKEIVPELSDISIGGHKLKTFLIETETTDVFLVCISNPINLVIGFFEFKISYKKKFSDDIDVYVINYVELHRDFVGKGIGTLVYNYIVNGLGYVLISDTSQSLKATYLWKKLMSSNKYDVYIIDDYYDFDDKSAKFFTRIYRAKDVLDSDYVFRAGNDERLLFNSDLAIALAKKSSPSSLKLNKLAKDGTLL